MNGEVILSLATVNSKGGVINYILHRSEGGGILS